MGFWLSFSMSGGTVPEAWRAVAGAVAEATTPIRVIGDSLLRMPVATGMLMVVGRVFREPGRRGTITCGEQDSTGVLVWARGWLASRVPSLRGGTIYMDAQDKQDGMGWMTRGSRVPSSTQTVIASAARQSRQGNDAAATTRSPRRCAPRDDKLGTREVGWQG